MMRRMRLDGRMIGPDVPPYVVAEMSGNHNGDLNRALAIIEAAAASGAHAVKLQTYTADTMTIDHEGPEFVLHDGLWAGHRLHQLYQEAHTPWEWHEALFRRGRELGLTVFSAPFDSSAVDFLESIDCPAYKIASFELIDLPLVAHVASTGKPMILSTGMAEWEEIEDAVHTAREAGCEQLGLLHCVSGYPTPPEDANLLTIEAMARRFQCPVGLSDHTIGTAVSVAAVALGAAVLEKHVTLRRADGGPDARFSLEPSELADLCVAAQTAWTARGEVKQGPTPSERGNRSLRRSLYVVHDVPAGTILTAEHVRSIRPANGLPPRYLADVLGRRTTRDLQRGTPFALDMVEDAAGRPGRGGAAAP